MSTRKRLADLSDEFCIEAYRLNQSGEGCALISGYGDVCSYRTASAAIDKGRRLVAAQAQAQPQAEPPALKITATAERRLAQIAVIADNASRDLGFNAGDGASAWPTVKQLNRTLARLDDIAVLARSLKLT